MTDQRAAVIAEAQAWLGTPYHHMARVKGAGCDCLTLLAAVYHQAGIVPAIEIPFYPPDWHLHRSAELYLNGLCEYARETKAPQPGDVALFKFARCFSHGAIIVDWPQRLIHAWHGLGVCYTRADMPPLLGRPVRFFSPFH